MLTTFDLQGKAKKKTVIPKYLAPKPQKEIAKASSIEDDSVLAFASKRDARLHKKMEKKQNLKDQVEAAEKTKKSVVKRKKKQPLPASFISFAQDIAKSLPTENKPENALRHGKKAKTKEILVKKEVEQFKNVLEHPVFKADPLAAIREHLTNSIQAQQENKQ